MAVNTQHRLINVRHSVSQRCDHVIHLPRRGIADRVGNVDRGGPGSDRRLNHPAEKIDLGAGSVLGREFNVVTAVAGPRHPGNCSPHHLVLIHSQLELAVNRTGCQKDMDAGPGRGSQRLPSSVDVAVVAAGQPADNRLANHFGDFTNRLKVPRGGDREASFDDVNLQLGQGMGNLNLLSEIHARAWRLLAVAEGRVKNANR